MLVGMTPVINAVLVQIVDGKPVVSLMLKDNDAREPLTRLGHEIIEWLEQKAASEAIRRA
jgi:hypothetical protein